MYYDSKVFKEHYGRMYFKIMYYGFGLALLILQLIYYPGFFGYPLSLNCVGFMALVICILAISVGISGYVYFYLRESAKKMRIWFDKDHIYFEEEKRVGWNSKKVEITYEISKVKQITMDNRYFKIDGSIRKKTDGVYVQANELKIPRTFTNEELLLRLFKIPKKGGK